MKRIFDAIRCGPFSINGYLCFCTFYKIKSRLNRVANSDGRRRRVHADHHTLTAAHQCIPEPLRLFVGWAITRSLSTSPHPMNVNLRSGLTISDLMGGVRTDHLLLTGFLFGSQDDSAFYIKKLGRLKFL